MLIERTPLPRHDTLPEDVRDLVLHQKHVVTYEQFGRDVAGLVEAIRFGRKAARVGAGGGGVLARWVGAIVLPVLVLGGGVLAYQMVTSDRGAEAKRQEDRGKADVGEKAEEDERKRLADVFKAEQDRMRAEDDRAKADAEKAKEEERRRVADAAATKKQADEEAQAKRAAEEAERQRLAMLKTEEDRKRAADEKKRAEAAPAAKEKADKETQAKRAAEQAERQHLALLQQEEHKKRAKTEKTASSPGRDLSPNQKLLFDLAAAGPTSAFTVDAWVDRSDRTYAIGQNLRVYVRPKQNAHITILTVGTSGKGAVVYPNYFHRDQLVRAGQTVAFPSDNSSWHISIQGSDGPPSVELMMVIASKEPFTLELSGLFDEQAARRLASKLMKVGKYDAKAITFTVKAK